MAVDAELAAIIGGSVAGAIILIAIITLIVCLCCGKRRQKKDREQKKFQQLTPHTSPSHSQPSSLGHGNPPPPTPASRKLAATACGWVPRPAVLQRAISETRLPQRQVSGGPVIYATGGSQQRIYHSQQMASLTPLYEVVDPRNGSVYDVYQIGGGSKTKLLQDGGGGSRQQADRDLHSHSGKSSKKVQRSQSDTARDSANAKRPHRGQKPSGHEGHQRSSKTGSFTNETAQVHEPKDQRKEAGRENAAFVGSMEKKGDVKAAASAATDSMKLLAKNKTDDQKKVVSEGSDTEGKEPSTAPAPDPSLHYTYGGDIYAVPDKEDSKRRSRSENPILARMQDMILESVEGLEPGGQVTQDHVMDTAEPSIISPVYSSPDHGASLIQNPLYQETEEEAGVVAAERETVRSTGPAHSESDGADITREILATVQLAADELDSGARNLRDIDVVVDDDVVATSAVTTLRDAGASVGGGGGGVVQQGEEGERPVVKEALDTRWSMDTDAATDEISRAGKHISVTAEAFGFLDTYLSDEDGGDIHSPPKSPMLSGGDELMY
ncbi:hypothetical protein ACOMHN_002006 [Nucella lapillus]